MIRITVTSRIVGTAHMYEELRKQGRRTVVPTYEVVASLKGKVLYRFAVTRRSRDQVFCKKPRHYQVNGECPPSLPDQPYRGRITTSGRLGFSIMLYEDWCPNRESLKGQGSEIRSGIKIHFGPATSFGCMAISNGVLGYESFVSAFKRISNKYGPNFEVVVEPRTV